MVDMIRCAKAGTFALLLMLAATSRAHAVDRAWAWGWNGYGFLGNGTTGNGGTGADSSVPTQVINISGATHISSGDGDHTLALLSDGSVWTWGNNFYGELGNGNSGIGTFTGTPQHVVGVSGAIDVAAGGNHSMALMSDGTIMAWGLNGSGQLGHGNDGDGAFSPLPVKVKNLTGVTQIACGLYTSAALRSDGTVWTWGYNGSKVIGDGTTDPRYLPFQVGITGVIKIAISGEHILALKADGTVWGWGDNADGEFGDGTQNNVPTPTQVPNLSGVVSIAAGQNYSLFIKSDGTLWVCGDNHMGQLGLGTTTELILTPTQVPGLSTVRSAAAGAFHTLILKTDGTVLAMGLARNGRLGNGVSSEDCYTSPVPVTGLTGVMEVTCGGDFSAAIEFPSFVNAGRAFVQNQFDQSIALLTTSGSTFVSSMGTTPNLPPGWQVVAAADFDHDGTSDIVVQNVNTRAVSILFMSGKKVQSSVGLYPILPPNWHVMASGDFNGDGKPDLVVQNMATQQVSVLTIDNATITGSRPLSQNLMAGWKVVGAADFNGDNKADLVVQNPSTRQISVLTLNGTSIIQSWPLSPTLPANWFVGGVSDYNGDGQPDLLVQNASTNQVAILTVANLKIISSHSVYPVPPAGWTLVGPK